MVIDGMAFWNKGVRHQVFELSDGEEPIDVGVGLIHITEDFCALNFERAGTTVVTVDSWLPPDHKRKAICRALGLCIGLGWDETTKSSVMNPGDGDLPFKVTRGLRKKVLELLEENAPPLGG